jgi:oxygen-independent coproporphyrinogen-3 oxidase
LNALEVSNLKYNKSRLNLSLYIHIPFCKTKCAYCDFYSIKAEDITIIQRVLEQTIKQAEYMLALLGEYRIKTIYIGGGTPSILNPEQLYFLLNSVNSLCGEKPWEWTIEVNPESLNSGFINMCRQFAVTRLSLGVQSFNNKMLKILERQSRRENIINELKQIKKVWMGDLNLDMMAGIPGQKIHGLLADLKTALDYCPQHISLYTLTLEPQTRLYKRLKNDKNIRLDQEQQDVIWLEAAKMLKRNGYQHYEVSNFSLPVKECRHNLQYWLLEPYLGVGPAAVSTLPGKGSKILRIYNPKDISCFINSGKDKWGMQTQVITADKFLFETLMMGWRLEKGIEKKFFKRRFGSDLIKLIPELWNDWQQRGFIKQSNRYYQLTRRARLLLNKLLSQLLDYQEVWQNIKIKEWPNL